MTTTPIAPPRHALGMPAGSVRALLAFGILGYLWILVLPISERYQPPIKAQPNASQAFLFLQLLLVLILAHFFAGHGRTIGSVVSKRSPLALPRGSVRFLLLGGYFGLLYYTYHHQWEVSFPTMPDLALFLGALLVGFIIGHALTGLMQRSGRLPAWFQDFQAWISLMALLLLGLLVLIRLVINPGVSPDLRLGLVNIEATLAALISFYFGARS